MAKSRNYTCSEASYRSFLTLTDSSSNSVSGKEDLDLGPNDLHLDDFLLSGKFDLIAYADPELNLEDKKDMFNEELDLGEPAEEKESGERKDGVCGSRKTDSSSHLVGQIKQEVRDDSKTGAARPGVLATSKPPGALGLEVSSVHHIKVGHFQFINNKY